MLSEFSGATPIVARVSNERVLYTAVVAVGSGAQKIEHHDTRGLPQYLFFESTSMEVSIYFHGNFHLLPWKLNQLPWK